MKQVSEKNVILPERNRFSIYSQTYNKMNRLAAILLSAILLSSCNNTRTSGEGQGENVTLHPIASGDAAPTTIFLKLLDRTDGDTSVTYPVKGLYKNDTIGFLLEVSKNIPIGINEDGSVNHTDGFKKGVIRFKRSGAESDRFVSALAELWQVPGVEKMSETAVEPLVFSSNNRPVDVTKSATYSFKLFFDEDAPNPAEVFFTFDTYKRSIEFVEKDEQFRPAMVRAFSAP